MLLIFISISYLYCFVIIPKYEIQKKYTKKHVGYTAAIRCTIGVQIIFYSRGSDGTAFKLSDALSPAM